MASFNRVILLGNLTRDPQVRYIPSGTAVADIGLAINRTWYDKATNQKREEATFVDVTLWGRDAEVAGEYLSKGRQLLVEGRLQLDTWDDKQTGQKRSKLRVVCESMTMVGSRNDGGAGGGGGALPQRGGQQGGRPAQRPQPQHDEGFPSEPSPAEAFYNDAPGGGSGGGGDSEEVPF